MSNDFEDSCTYLILNERSVDGNFKQKIAMLTPWTLETQYLSLLVASIHEDGVTLDKGPLGFSSTESR